MNALLRAALTELGVDTSRYDKAWAEGGLAAVSELLASDGLTQLYNLVNVETAGSGPKDSTLGQSKYDFRSRRFPMDLGDTDSYHGHYMVININVSDHSKFATTKGGGSSTTNFTRFKSGSDDGRGGDGGTERSKVDALRGSIDATWTNSEGKSLGQPVFISRRTTRIKESIALYMPGTLYFTGRNAYNEASLTEMAKEAIASVGGLADKMGSFTSMVAGLAGTAVRTGEQIAQLRQQPINPRIELFFSNTALREFQFDFQFAPSSPEESQSLKEIIHALRFHAAPEYNAANLDSAGAALASVLWTPPSEFDITFYNRGVENTSIPRINTCVLNSIDLDYAPSGNFSTFRDGTPVATRMQLGFQEVEVLHRLRIAQGF